MRKFLTILTLSIGFYTCQAQAPTLAIRNSLLGRYAGTYWDFNTMQEPAPTGVKITALPNDSAGIISTDTIYNITDTLFVGFYYDINHQLVVDTILYFPTFIDCGDVYPIKDSIFYGRCKPSSNWEPIAYFSLNCTYHYIPTNINSALLNNFKIYPIPLNDKLYLEFNDEKNNRAYELYDNTGRKIFNGIAYKSKNEIDTGILPLGIYFLKIIVDGKEATRKIIKAN